VPCKIAPLRRAHHAHGGRWRRRLPTTATFALTHASASGRGTALGTAAWRRKGLFQLCLSEQQARDWSLAAFRADGAPDAGLCAAGLHWEWGDNQRTVAPQVDCARYEVVGAVPTGAAAYRCRVRVWPADGVPVPFGLKWPTLGVRLEAPVLDYDWELTRQPEESAEGAGCWMVDGVMPDASPREVWDQDLSVDRDRAQREDEEQE